MTKRTLEVCVDSVESALAAERGGADRIELCGNLVIGGTTPGQSLFEEIRKVSQIRIHALIRPRFGDFLYTDYEFSQICREVELFRQMGAEGVVVGVLKADGRLDAKRMEVLREAAGDMWVTLHRAFDVCCDPFAALEIVKTLGIQAILTSGQEEHCLAGRDLLHRLKEAAGNQVEIMAGAGVDAAAIRTLRREAGLCSFHMSGKAVLESGMHYRKANVKMGLPSFSEFEIWRTDEEKIREARRAADR